MSYYLELSGAPLIRADIRLPLVGAWVADVEHVNTPSVAEGDRVSLTLGAQSWTGTVLRVETAGGRNWDCRIVGGAGGLGTTLTPKQYISPPASLVLQDALAEAGESAEASTLAALSSTLLRGWVRRQVTLGQELDALSRLLRLRWRVVPSGSVSMGTEPGTPVALAEAQVLEEDAARGRVVLAVNEPTVTPGQIWTSPETGASWEVGAVVIRVDELETRAEIWRTSGPGRLGEMLDTIARTAAPPDLFGVWEYTVILQNLDGTLDLRTGDDRAPDLSRVPYYPGGPGETFTVSPGARCLVAFLDGSEQHPTITSWISASTLTHDWRTNSAKISSGGVATDVLKEGAGFHAQMGASLTEVAAVLAALGIPATATTTMIGSLAADAFRSSVLDVE